MSGELPTGLYAAYYNAFNNVAPTMNPPAGVVQRGDMPYHSQSVAPRNLGLVEWDRYTPSTPSSNDVECYVEVIDIRQIGGRCTQLGGTIQPYICQSGQHFEFKPECQQILRARQNSQRAET
ncbi:hypothetical protein ACF0H5_001657 [Mactra antiquata]